MRGEGTHLPVSQRFIHCERCAAFDMDSSCLLVGPLTPLSFQRSTMVLLGRETFKVASGQLLSKNQSNAYILPHPTCHCLLLVQLSAVWQGHLVSSFPGTYIPLLNAKNTIRPTAWTLRSHSSLISGEGETSPHS